MPDLTDDQWTALEPTPEVPEAEDVAIAESGDFADLLDDDGLPVGPPDLEP